MYKPDKGLASASPEDLPSDPETLVDEQFVADYYSVARRTVKLWRYEGRGPEFLRLSSTVVRYRWGAILAHNDRMSAASTSDESARQTDAA